MRSVSLIFGAMVVALSITGQTLPATLLPMSPTSNDVVTASFSVPAGCGTSHVTTVSGLTVRTITTLTGCPFTPGVETIEQVAFGPLPPGLYTYEIYLGFDALPPAVRSSQSFLVLASTIPALSPNTLALLIAALGTMGTVVIARIRN